MMKRVGTLIRWFALGMVVLLVTALLGVWWLTHSPRFLAFLRPHLVSTLNGVVDGEVELGGLEGVLWNRVTLHDLVIHHKGVELLRAPHVTLRYKLLPLLQRRVEITAVEIEEPVLQVVQDEAGNWNIVTAFAGEESVPSAPSEPSTLTIKIQDIRLQSGQITITLGGKDKQTYVLTDTTLDAGLDLPPTGIALRVRHLATQITATALPTLQVKSVLAYEATGDPASVQIHSLEVTTDHSALQLAGRIKDLQTVDLDALLTVKKLAIADVKQVAPEFPLQQDISGTVQLQGPLADLHVVLNAGAATSTLTVDMRTNLRETPLHYDGTVKLTNCDLQQLLDRKDLRGVVNGTVDLRGSGTELSDLTAQVAMDASEFHAATWQLGKVTLTGGLEQKQATFTTTVHGAVGRATVQGKVGLTDTPDYALTVVADQLDIARVVPGKDPVPGTLQFRGVVHGKGTDLATLQANADVEVSPSTVGPVRITRGRFLASIAEERVRITEATLDAQDTNLIVKGELGTTPTAKGQLSYYLQTSDLAPWLTLAGYTGAGSLTLEGEARGSFSELQTQGTVKGTNLKFADQVIQRASVMVTGTGLGSQHARGNVRASLDELRIGTPLRRLDIVATLTAMQPLSLQVIADARDPENRPHHVKADIVADTGQNTVRLAELSLAVPGSTWELAQPTTVTQRGEQISLTPLLLRSGTQQISLRGGLSLRGAQEVDLEIARFALATLQPVLPQQPEVRGLLAARVHLGGTAATPTLTSQIAISDLLIAGQTYAGLDARATYDAQRFRTEITFRQDDTHTLVGTTTLPIAVRWSDGWTAEVLGDLDGQVRSTGLDLAFLNAVTGKAVQDVAGALLVDLTVQGPVTAPQPYGTIRLREGKANLKDLRVKINELNVDAQLSPDTIRITQLSARARDGRMSGTATLTLKDRQPDQITASLVARKWPAIRTREYDVELAADVQCEGRFPAPQITGRVEVTEATLRPDLAVLTETPVKRDETITVIPVGGPPVTSPEVAAAPDQPAKQPDLFRQLALDLQLIVRRNTWIKHNNADIELAGQVHATKPSEQDLRLVGTIETVRGWVGFKGRRFTLTKGDIAFQGATEIDPNLDIVAEHRFPQHVVDILVGGTATAPALQFRSEPELDQADILSLILFGKQVNALEEGEKTNLQQQAVGLVGGYAATMIGESVSQALGLEDLGIDLRDADLAGGQVGFGRYLGPNTYLSMSQQVGGKGGREVSVEQHLNTNWTVRTSSSSTGDNSVGILWHKQY
ncbi:MAG: translocation/assembly module TamB domain-containing protein [Candidatus Binatia bacterium]